MAFNEIIISDEGQSIQVKRSEKGRQALVGYEQQHRPTLVSLRDRVLSSYEKTSSREFLVEHEGVRLKVLTVDTARGAVHVCRRMIHPIPPFARLKGIPEEVRMQMVELGTKSQSGIALFSSLPNGGKTTTMLSVMARMIKDWGDVAVVLEPAPELDLDAAAQGTNGRIFQVSTKVAEGGYDRLLGSVLTLGPRLVAVGSISTAMEARLVVDLAMAGALVSTTVPANGVIAAISNLISRAAETMGPDAARDAVAMCLRACLHQSIGDLAAPDGDVRELRCTSLFLPDPSVSPTLSKKIKSDGVQGLAQDISNQETRIRNHSMPLGPST